MASYTYNPSMYFIENRKKLQFSEKGNSIKYDFQWVIQCKAKAFSLTEDPKLEKGNQYLGFIHELTHYYQDLSLCSCISEHIYKTKMAKSYYDAKFVEITSPIKLTIDEISIYNYIYTSPISIEINSLRAFSEGKSDLSFVENGVHFFPSITYRDLLECYAEIKAWQSILCEAPVNVDNYQYIYQLLKNKHDKLKVDENGNPAVSFKYNEKGFDRYSIIRAVFLSFFHHCPPNKYKIYNGVIPNSRTTVIDYLLTMGQIPVEESYDICDDYCISIPVNVSSFDYLIQFELNFLSTLLFALDVALTIPTTSRIEKLVRDGDYKVEDFHPCIRFYKVISMFYKYPDYFNNLDSDINWMSVFDDIADLLDWPRYYPTIKDVSNANKFFHGGNMVVYQEHFLSYHMNTTMESNNGAILRMFRNMNIPIILRYPDNFVVVRYSNNNVYELVVDDNRLYSYLSANSDDLFSYTEDDEILLQQIFSNKIDIQLYKNINKMDYKCPLPNLNCKQSCNVYAMSELFNTDNPKCFIQHHIRKEIWDFYKKINGNK